MGVVVVKPADAECLELAPVAVVAAPRMTLEMVSIGAGVFAIVQGLLHLGVTADAIWLAVLTLAMSRKLLGRLGVDLVFDRSPRYRRV